MKDSNPTANAVRHPEPRQQHGAKLRRLRTAAALSQAQLAEKLGTTKQAVSRWETGLNEPSQRHKQALADLYDLPVEELSRNYDWFADDGSQHGYRRSEIDPQKLRAVREALGLTQTEAAQRAALSVGAISQYEAGIVKPKTNTIIRLATAYDQPLEALMTPSVHRGPDQQTD